MTRSDHDFRHLLQAQKLEAVGRLAGSIAHDFNNMLLVINGYSDLVAARVGDNDIRADVQEIRRAGERAATLTRQLLAYSRPDPPCEQVVSLNDVVSGIESMLRAMVGDTISLNTALAPAVRPVLADVGQLEQVLVNLVVNARGAMPDGGTVWIETADVSSGTVGSALAPGDGYARLRVRDSGVGMDAQTRRRIFDAFFTTKPPGEGTGLGLAIVLEIVQHHGGHVDVTSSPGAGATFDVCLPTSGR